MNLLATSLLIAASYNQSPAAPGVRCVHVVPYGEQPTAGISERLNTVLKDVQWWYSCQMEAHGYGPKTFSLELDENGRVVIHTVQIPETAPSPTDAENLRSSVVMHAEKVMGRSNERNGTIMLLAYDGYYWTDRAKLQMQPMAWGLDKRWAHLTGWHINGINPQGFTNNAQIPTLPEQNPYFSPIATKTYQAYTADGSRSIGERASCSHGTFIHEMGHAFGLHHPAAGDPKWVGDMMTGDGFWNARGNFVEGRTDWCCLTPDQAATLNRNPLFQIQKVGQPSTGVARQVGMRGAVDSVFNPRTFAQVKVTGTGFTMEPLSKGHRSQSNRDYVWKDVPLKLDGTYFTRFAGGQKAGVSVQAISGGRLYIASAQRNPDTSRNGGWQLISPTISYAGPDLKQVYPMYLYYRTVRARDVIEVAQRDGAGTIVIAPSR